MAKPGDYVVVHAWTNHQEMAIAYNISTQNDTTGRIPADLLSKEEPQPVIGSGICIPRSLNKPSRFGGLTWKAGDYIRTYK